MSYTLEFFANERYDMLKALSEKQVDINGNLIIALTQQEIAEMQHISKLKANEIINELIREGFVSVSRRSRYSITNKGYAALRMMCNNRTDE